MMRSSSSLMTDSDGEIMRLGAVSLIRAVAYQAFFARFTSCYAAPWILKPCAARTQQSPDLDATAPDLLGTLDETLKPTQLRLWLLP